MEKAFEQGVRVGKMETKGEKGGNRERAVSRPAGRMFAREELKWMLEQERFDQTKSWQSNWAFLRGREKRLTRMTARIAGEVEGAIAVQDG